MTKAPVRARYVELDAARGVAICMMVIFHLVFDLSFFSIYLVETSHGFWRLFGYMTAALFVLIAGVAVALRAGRTPPSIAGFTRALPFFRRGIFLIGVGLLVTVGTCIFLHGEGYVLFGILQLIGTSTILAPLFFRLGKKTVIPGIIILLAGWMITLPNGPIWLLWAGIHPVDYISVDYTPLIPWFGVFLVGMAMGAWLYPNGLRSFWLPVWVEQMFHIPSIPGRYSLIIYLVHQPVLLLILSGLYGKIPGI
ncbi:heparan-alpha-glucosaminide N-acetyltransferase [uncultured Methanospirillum sp.]|uniref:heparan-alpha-glucosaminide N-acetyltransferase n=1 Tax=uncultured Methanospirillum sp. TaxID=262503 RepID=UPI0029C5FC4C|nr:heparan-alpha-glucosaminide N-acetyltransferase [uncultured Methanospirillum sp.]